jgi:hypothetical protein
MTPQRALFVDEVSYRMPRRLKDKRRRGVLIINGFELAVVQTEPMGAQGEGDANVIANFPISKVRRRAGEHDDWRTGAMGDCRDPQWRDRLAGAAERATAGWSCVC